jgi:uncharacterized protein YfiM (DUF2279 family)
VKTLLLLVFVVLPLLLIAAIAAIIVTGIESRPLVARSQSADAASLARGKALVIAYRESLLRPDALTTLSASEADINRVLSLAGRGLKNATFDAHIRPTGMVIAASVRLPKTPLGEYFNGYVGVAPSRNGLQIDTVRVGKVAVPGWIVVAAMRMGLDGALGEGRGDEALASIREVDFTAQRVQVTYRPTPELIADLQRTAKDAYRQVVVDIDPALVRAYFAALVETGKSYGKHADVSFTAFLGPMLALAKQRSQSGAAAAENAAAIVAMAIYFGDNRFEKIVGKVRTGELAGTPLAAENVKLRGRHDLVQHFTISAALTVTAGLGIADVIGEIKEVQDTGAGGSGFSFTDIAADRTGARFGETATGGSGAIWVQNLLAGDPLENMFFPSIAGLPEFMSRAEFVRRFSDVGSPEYDKVVREIDQRIAALAVFGR